MKKLLEASGWIAIICFLFGCVSVHKAKDVLDKHPGDAASYCAEKFPFKDSAGAPEYVNGSAKNENYQGKIDSLFEFAAGLSSKIYQDSVKYAQDKGLKMPFDSLGMAKDLEFYRVKVKALSDQVIDLKARFKPCVPDTLKVPRFIENTAKMDAALFKVAQLEKALAVSEDKSRTWEDKAKKRGTALWAIIGAVGLSIAIGIILKIKKF